ncbi:hypothetical protein MLD38_038709 [Melastoma candidum]|uniref:Uncharacterized protein n=1 Tax=Melastoma candidum TaxID=119954 RepID=A0ACB9L223_9MYRT|nr:hypothetical protein MLD38_038709 [Melastoma candidum]
MSEMEAEDLKTDDVESASSDSMTDSDGSIESENEHDLQHQEPLTEQEIQEMIDEFLEVESKAAEAQEALEKESLAKLEVEVLAELKETLEGDELERAVADELATYQEEWEAELDRLETESAHLLEQLDGAGIELPRLFKWIDSQAPNGCSTEAWKKRTHWVGSQITCEITTSVAEAEKHLQAIRPVRSRHGRVLEEGASGFLQKKLIADESKDAATQKSEIDWGSLNKIFSGCLDENATSFGSKHWASVYFASTPQQAAQIGIKFPGVDEVEEIDDIDGNPSDPLVADAIAHERELVLSEEQRKNFRKIKEEDDAILDKKLQLRLKRRRYKKRGKKKATLKERIVEDATEICEKVEIDTRQSCGTSEEMGERIARENGSSSFSHDTPDYVNVLENGSKKFSRNPDKDGELQFMESDGTLADQSTKLEGSHSVNLGFSCTVCGKVADIVHQHPLLKVIVCKSCKSFLQGKMSVEGSECLDCYCGWCGHGNDLVSCRSCKMLFCASCIERNFGKEYISEVQASGWQCCCCLPSMLDRMSSQLENALVTDNSDTDSGTSESDTDISMRSKKRRKRKIRRIIDDTELGEETKRKIAIEKERQERLKSLQVQFTAKSDVLKSTSTISSLSEDAAIDVLGDATTGYVVNVVREKGEEVVRLPPSISQKLKAHQVAGIRFMWENIVQCTRKVRSGDKGLGCILAHTMGLGKTLQVIAFLYAALKGIDLGLRTALIVTPVNVLHNWRHEFSKWMPTEYKALRIFMLEDVPRERRLELLTKWKTKGGVFLISYSSFRNLSLGKYVKDSKMARDIIRSLQDGPDILVCDEAHMIKNTRAGTTRALKMVKCQRRIALTGSPLQNNLMEYFCMVDFVREGFLGSSHEFRNRFQNPIENGQHTNSTLDDVRIMNQRSHILFEQLKGFVQRMDMNVVKKDLPPKTVFVIAVKLSALQRKLYRRFLDVHGFTNGRVYNENMPKRSFFAGYQALAQIWNHPGILQLIKEDRESLGHEDAGETFILDDSSSDENMAYNGFNGVNQNGGSDLLRQKNVGGFLRKGWWNDLLTESDFKDVNYGGKMVLLLDILSMCSDVGDKALVFSQSIPTLDLIELYLSRLPRKEKRGKFWKKGKDWYRLDGKTESSERQKLVERFNEPLNRRVKCTLISTRAGSLGINLYAANRVVIVDGSWNPTYDLQAIYRAWRYGQKKPVYAYRLMAQGTMEEKIYKRQVTKEGLAARVVDRQQVHRTISKEEMLHLFDFGDDDNAEVLNDLCQEHGAANNPGPLHHSGNLTKKKSPPSVSCSSDKLMESLASKHYPSWITNYHEHETLLQENEEEKLSKEEQDMAWEVYRKSLQWEEVPRAPINEPVTEKPPAAKLEVPMAEPNIMLLSEDKLRKHSVQRKCTNLAHLLTLRSQGTKTGCSTVCGECAQEISWEGLNRDCKPRR